MTAKILMIAPGDAGAPIVEALAAAHRQAAIDALLLPRGERDERRYRELVKAVAPPAQQQGIAVLIEGEPGHVRMLGADGLHLTAPSDSDLRDAVAALHPQFMIGVGGIESRHAAMTAGELGADYILFGPLSGRISEHQRELARWWAETMEIPSVLSDPDAGRDSVDAESCEFIGLRLPTGGAPE